MKLLLIGCLLIISGFSFTTAVAQSSQTQQSINNNSGVALQAGGNISNVNLTIIHGSTDYKKLKNAFEEAKQNAEEYPDNTRFIEKLKKAKKELDDFTSQIQKLYKDINKITFNNVRGKKAKQLFEKGDYQAAREVLDAKEMNQELQTILMEEQEYTEKLESLAAHKENLAEEFILKARLTAFDYSLGEKRIPETRQVYEQALKFGDNDRHVSQYLAFLLENNLLSDVIAYLQTRCPSGYMSKWRGCNFLLLMRDAKYRIDSLEEELLEDLEYIRKTGDQDRVATKLSILGMISAANCNQLNKSETYYQEALRIRRELEKTNTDASLHSLSLAGTLTSLSIIYDKCGLLEKSISNLQESLAIYRELAKSYPALFLPDVATVLTSLGNTYLKWQQPEQAIPYLQEAHQLFTNLEKDAPGVFSEKVEWVEKLLKQTRGDK